MIEAKDVIGWAIGSVGWLLAGYQYWRNELSRRPLIVVDLAPFEANDHRFGGKLYVRNRWPWDIKVEDVTAVAPAGMMLLTVVASFRGADGYIHSHKATASRHLGWHLAAYSSGEFPSGWAWFGVELPAGKLPSSVKIEVTMTLSRSASFSRRVTRRHRIRIVNK